MIGFADGDTWVGGIPPAPRNQRAPTGAETPASIAASSLGSSTSDRLPEAADVLTLPSGRMARRTQLPARTPIRSTLVSLHRNLLHQGVPRPVESALRPPLRMMNHAGCWSLPLRQHQCCRGNSVRIWSRIARPMILRVARSSTAAARPAIHCSLRPSSQCVSGALSDASGFP